MRGILGIGVAVLSALAVAGCGLQQSLSQVADPGNGPTGPATPITAQTVAGAPYDWSTTHGHVVVLDFWGSWCAPCRDEQPDLNKLFTEFAPKGVIFLGVDLNDNDPSAIAYQRDFHVAYPSVNDASEVVASEYNVIAPPELLVVNAKGTIVDRYIGTLSGVRDDLNRLLATA